MYYTECKRKFITKYYSAPVSKNIVANPQYFSLNVNIIFCKLKIRFSFGVIIQPKTELLYLNFVCLLCKYYCEFSYLVIFFFLNRFSK